MAGFFATKGIDLNDEKYDEQPEFAVLPPGNYPGSIADATWKETKKGGHYIALKISIDGGGTVWENLNLDNQNETAQRIAIATYKAIYECAGLPPNKEGSGDELAAAMKGLPVHVELKTETYVTQNGDRRERNGIKRYLKVDSSAPVQPRQSGSPVSAGVEDLDDEIPF